MKFYCFRSALCFIFTCQLSFVCYASTKEPSDKFWEGISLNKVELIDEAITDGVDPTIMRFNVDGQREGETITISPLAYAATCNSERFVFDKLIQLKGFDPNARHLCSIGTYGPTALMLAITSPHRDLRWVEWILTLDGVDTRLVTTQGRNAMFYAMVGMPEAIPLITAYQIKEADTQFNIEVCDTKAQKDLFSAMSPGLIQVKSLHNRIEALRHVFQTCSSVMKSRLARLLQIDLMSDPSAITSSLLVERMKEEGLEGEPFLFDIPKLIAFWEGKSELDWMSHHSELWDAYLDQLKACAVREAIEAGANVNALMRVEGVTPLAHAITHNAGRAVFECLYQYGVDFNLPSCGLTPLVFALSPIAHHRGGNRWAIWMLQSTAEGPLVNCDASLTGRTALRSAVDIRDLDAMRELLIRGADPLITDEYGVNSWGAAVMDQFPNFSIIRGLASKIQSLNAPVDKHFSDQTAVDWVLKQPTINYRLLDVLVECGVKTKEIKLNAQDEVTGTTRLMRALNAKDYRLAKALLALGSDPNILNHSGVPAIAYVLLSDPFDQSMAEILVDKGSVLDIRLSDGDKLWAQLLVTKKVEAAKWLVEKSPTVEQLTVRFHPLLYIMTLPSLSDDEKMDCYQWLAPRCDFISMPDDVLRTLIILQKPEMASTLTAWEKSHLSEDNATKLASIRENLAAASAVQKAVQQK